MAQHIISGVGTPTITPTDIGQHYIDTTNKKSYISVGTSSSSDWSMMSGVTPYIHTQSSPLSIWTIAHNLGYNPIVSIFSSGGLSVEADVLNLNSNTLTVSFNTAFAGFARLI